LYNNTTRNAIIKTASNFSIMPDVTGRCYQCRLNAWARWAVAHGPHEHMDPMIIYVCCIQHVF